MCSALRTLKLRLFEDRFIVVASPSLVTPFDAPLPGARYLFLTLDEVAQRDDIRKRRDWMVQRMQRDAQSGN
ncbi:hypothetical protein ACMGGS_17650 [Superficieibacter sp. BNK-5]|uniref:hypothetical protein n=1 Tax=Superficieibacter sp. BNK-5 TaxID=3376142 RepID=UPI0039BEFF88